MNKYFTTLLLFALVQLSSGTLLPAQVILSEVLHWNEIPLKTIPGQEPLTRWSFQGAVFDESTPTLPYFTTRFPISGPGQLQVEWVQAVYEDFPSTVDFDDRLPGSVINFYSQVYKEFGKYYGQVAFVPIINDNGSYKRLKELQIRIIHQPAGNITQRGPQNKETSVLADGEIYKIAVSKTGMYKLNSGFLKDLGIDVDKINPRQIKIYGNGGGMVPALLNKPREDDLIENAIFVEGEADGKFDANDFVLFYAEGPDKWYYNTQSGIFEMERNLYDTKNYYFIKISPENGRRAALQENQFNPSYTTDSFDDYARLEEDDINLLAAWDKLKEGSGQKWYGAYFRGQREYEYRNVFQFPNTLTSEPLKIKAEMALRSRTASTFYVDINGQTINSSRAIGLSHINRSNDTENDYASTALAQGELDAPGDNLTLKIVYPIPSGSSTESEGWLDYVQANVRRKLTMAGDQMLFRDKNALQYASAGYRLEAGDKLSIWDISSPLSPRVQSAELNGGVWSFAVTVNSLPEFVAFDAGKPLLIPEKVGKIGNQNLHGIANADMLIVYHETFESQAMLLKDHRQNYSGLKVEAVPVSTIYNEFSSGRLDPSAIRDFAKMLFERSNNLKYLLLLGDGSFDHKNKYEAGNNFIPVYETESLNPLFAFPSDDFFGILQNPNNTSDPIGEPMSIAVGRLPVNTQSDAQNVVAKIIHYDTQPKTFSDWRNRLVFVGDDEDNSIHTSDVDRIANRVAGNHKGFNIEKIYLDAFPQEANTGGDRFPLAQESINKAIFKGALAMTYLGHGGPQGWAQERVLQIPDINSWTNIDHLPLIVTATCSFTSYDNPNFVSAGEEAMLNPKGGAIALLTTTRAVYANYNAELTEKTLDLLFAQAGKASTTLGESMIRAKNEFTFTGILRNSRKFALIGDPATVLPLPVYNVTTTEVNGKPVGQASADTLRALQKVTIKGIVTDPNGQPFTGFNGIVYPTIFDKFLSLKTLGQDDDSRVLEYTIQKNVIFKGRATVTNGSFEFTFVVPKDINYSFGLGKISYYAADLDKKIDASGFFDRIFIGGNAAGVISDKLGPEIEVFLNSEDFVFGGITNDNPLLIATLNDESGINIAGNSIGHDLEGKLNNNSQNIYQLNDFYEADLNDYRKGTVRYPLGKLPEGLHQIKVKAWDVANNASEGYTEFIVAASAEVALQHVLNYPNPFVDRTCFQFDHNAPNNIDLEVQVQIFTISGRLIKTIAQTVVSDGSLRQDDCINWDGRDDFGDRLGRGVYLYQIKLKSLNAGNSTIKGESSFEKLVVLK